MAGMDALPVHQARHLHAAAFRQIGNQSFVFDVAVNHCRLAGLDGMDDNRAILAAVVDRELEIIRQFLLQQFILFLVPRLVIAILLWYLAPLEILYFSMVSGLFRKYGT